jgi:Family of unknown function (DUF5706)
MPQPIEVSAPDVIEDRLRYIVGLVDGQLRFAETKNAGLLILNSAAVAAAVQILVGSPSPGVWTSRYLVVFILGHTLSGVIVLLSLLPISSLSWFAKRGDCRDSDSLLFFGDCHKYGVNSYLAALYKACRVTPELPPPPLYRMYTEQTINNSRIAWRKFSYFRGATWATMCGLFTPVVAIILFVVVHTYDSVLESS